MGLMQLRVERERNVLFNDALNTFYLRLWHQTYGKEPFRWQERKLAAAT